MLRYVYFILIVLLPCFPVWASTVSWEKMSRQTCRGRLLNPVTEVNWSMIFPIRIGKVPVSHGISGVKGSGEAGMIKRAFCHCSHGIGLHMPGLLVSFHQPLFLEEIVKTPGCFSSLGGFTLLHGYENEHSNLAAEDEEESVRWQVHWYAYPLFILLDMFKSFACVSHGQFRLIYLTEIDPTWQDDSWEALYAPESLLFSSAALQAACMTDAVSSTAGHPIDKLYWCAGSWGPVFPLTGNMPTYASRVQSAQLAGVKMIARLARMGFLKRTVGADAICHYRPMHIWVKSQFHLDPVYPIARRGAGLPIGASTLLWENMPVQTKPGYENINQVVFQAQQCCIRPHF